VDGVGGAAGVAGAVRTATAVQLADGLELLRWTPAGDVDVPTAPVGRVRELVVRQVGVPTRIVKNEVLGNCVDHRSGLRDDDELGPGVAGLNLASSGDVVVDAVAFLDVAHDTDL